MPKPLSSLQELVELTIFHRLRLEIVSQGYLPDISTYPNTTVGYTNYKAALAAIANGTKQFAVEVFNNSSPDYKGLVKLPRIVILSELMLPGEVGASGCREYRPVPGVDPEAAPGSFHVLSRPPQTVDYAFNLHIIADNAVQLRIINAMVVNAIPLRGYIPAYKLAGLNMDDFNFFIENISATPLPILKTEDFSAMEYVYRYRVKDLFLLDYIGDAGLAIALQEIKVKFHMDGDEVQEEVIS